MQPPDIQLFIFIAQFLITARHRNEALQHPTTAHNNAPKVEGKKRTTR
jgi:hypothetical protein